MAGPGREADGHVRREHTLVHTRSLISAFRVLFLWVCKCPPRAVRRPHRLHPCVGVDSAHLEWQAHGGRQWPLSAQREVLGQDAHAFECHVASGKQSFGNE